MLYSIFKALFFLLFKIFLRFEIKGSENIPEKGGFILASNHLSNLDPIALGAACPRKLNFMAKDSLFRNSLFSWILERVGAFPLKRNSADPSALKEAITRLSKGEALVVFPEGTRRKGTSHNSAQPGVGFLVAKTNSPIIPSYIKGTDLVLPKGYKFIRLRKISVYFGKQISLERSESHNYQDIADKTMYGIGHLACS
jgi:1-acyl-sn-glycerol-3-phosphate acyltransferase